MARRWTASGRLCLPRRWLAAGPRTRSCLGRSVDPSGLTRTWGFGQLIPRRQWDAWKRLQDGGLSAFERERLSDLLNIGVVVHGEPFDEDAVASGAERAVRLALAVGQAEHRAGRAHRQPRHGAQPSDQCISEPDAEHPHLVPAAQSLHRKHRDRR